MPWVRVSRRALDPGCVAPVDPSSVAQCLADWLRTKTELEMVHPFVPALDRLMGQIRPHPPDELAVSI